MEDEEANHQTKTFPLPKGIEREAKCMGAGLQAGKLSTRHHEHIGFGVCPDCDIAKKLEGKWCVMVEDEEADHQTKPLQLPMGIEREAKCIGAGPVSYTHLTLPTTPYV